MYIGGSRSSQKPPKFNEKTHSERQKKQNWWRETGKKREILGGPRRRVRRRGSKPITTPPRVFDFFFIPSLSPSLPQKKVLGKPNMFCFAHVLYACWTYPRSFNSLFCCLFGGGVLFQGGAGSFLCQGWKALRM